MIVCPLRFFALTAGWERQVWLSFSYTDEARIAEGIGRLARFVRQRIGGGATG